METSILTLCLLTQLFACGPWDNDGDNFDEASNDCDDSNPDIHPYALETCDGIDNNCDGYRRHSASGLGLGMPTLIAMAMETTD